MQITANGKRLPILSRQTLLVMKLLMIFTLATCLYANANMSAQTVTLTSKQSTLEKVMREVRKQTGYAVVFNNSIKAVAKPVTVEAQDMALESFLQQCFRDQPLTYEILTNKTIVIKEKKVQALVTEGLTPSLDPLPPPPTDVTIIVLNNEGQPLEGASVTVKGNNKGLVTDLNGRVTFKAVDDAATLVVSFTGYQSQEFKINKRTSIAIRLQPSTSELDEMQVIAYGKVSKRFNVGNVTTVKGEDIEKQPVTNVLQALENRVPGLFITQANGLPNGGVTVRLQGQNSINNGSDPLYVIDGVPYFSQLPSTGASNSLLGTSGGQTNGITSGSESPLSYINPSDIESVEVLKDADATAIYGSRAANGAILITTKKGKPGATRLEINSQSGWGKVPKMLDLLNTSQYLSMRREAMRNDGFLPSASPTAVAPYKYAPDLSLWDTTRYTDWQKTLIGGTANYTNLSASLSGGTDFINYLLGATYNRQGVVFPGDYGDKKASVHFAITGSSTNKRFNFQFSGNYMNDDNNIPAFDLTNAIMLPPDAPPPYNADGTLNWAPNATGGYSWSNPYANLYGGYTSVTNNLISNLTMSYRLLPGLDIRNSVGYTTTTTNDENLNPLAKVPPEFQTPSNRYGYFGTRRLNSFIIEPQLNFRRSVKDHSIDILLGATIQQTNTNVSTVTASGFSSDQLLRNFASASSVTGTSNITNQKYAAAFGRFNYRFKNRYIADITVRRDGSSRFGPESRYHNFWSLGGGWIFSEEAKLKKSFPGLSFGKLSASYGTTGSDQIGDYAYLNLYNSSGTFVSPYQGTTGLFPGGLVNPSLQWEETQKTSIALDLGFLRDKILFHVNYARNQSSNQLTQYNLPSMVGAQRVYLNLPATIRNTSWEFSLNTTNIHGGKFSWTTNVNLTIPKNVLAKFDGLSKTNISSFYIVGQPLSFIRLYHFLGVNPQNGMYQVEDIRGNPTLNPVAADKTIMKILDPIYFGGIGNQFRYSGFQLEVFLSFTQRYAKNNLLYSSTYPGNIGNQLASIMDNRWQQPGEIASVQKFSTSAVNTIINGSDFSYAEGFLARVKTVSLSYQLPSRLLQRLHIADCSVYLHGQNMFTITNFHGLDPETQAIGSLPPLRVLTLGVRMKL
ncbi:MAG: SusC/RagA family TonB-linked outer membrane protein [Bacteroidota bacterium]